MQFRTADIDVSLSRRERSRHWKYRRHASVRYRSYREDSECSGICTAGTICILTSIILKVNPASKYCRYSQYIRAGTAGTSSTLDCYSTAVTTRCVCRYPPAACTSYGTKLSKRYALEEWSTLRASVQSWSTYYLYVAAVVRACVPGTTQRAAAAEVLERRASWKASYPWIYFQQLWYVLRTTVHPSKSHNTHSAIQVSNLYFRNSYTFLAYN